MAAGRRATVELPAGHSAGPREETSVSSVPLPLRKSATPLSTSRRPVSAASTRFARPDPSGPGGAKLLDNLRRLGAVTDGAATDGPVRDAPARRRTH